MTETRPRPRQETGPERHPAARPQVRNPPSRTVRSNANPHRPRRDRLVRSSGRLIAAEIVILCEAIALAEKAEKAAARQRGEVAA